MGWTHSTHETHLGRAAESALVRWLLDEGWSVLPTHRWTSNTGDHSAPMMLLPGGSRLVLPDLLAWEPGADRPRWIEVKAKTEPGWHRARERWEHGVNLRHVRDYEEVARRTGFPVDIYLAEVRSPQGDGPNPAWTTPGGWMRAPLDALREAGVHEPNWPTPGGDGGLLWPRSAMTPLDGPLPLTGPLGPVTTEAPIAQDEAPVATAVDRYLDHHGIEGPIRHALFALGHIPPEPVVRELLLQGVRVTIASDDRPDWPHLARFIRDRERPYGLLEHHRATGLPIRVCADGRIDSALRQTLAALDSTTAFNAGQYLAALAPVDADVRVMAGAGTGKTAVMIERVLFLLHSVADLGPRGIGLITFTREATRVMRSRLRQALAHRLELTRRPCYFHWLQSLGTMPIHTFHAFGKELLGTLGHHAGLGHRFRIASLTTDRARILEEEIDAYLAAHPETDPAILFGGERLYQVAKRLDRIWSSLVTQGVSADVFPTLDWGHAPAGPERMDFVKTVITNAEARFEQMKVARGVVTPEDLVRRVDGLRAHVRELSRGRDVPEFLLVDEFQDTDDAQIRLVSTLRNDLGTRLYVVGDVKQSIYRFRGAKSRAFDILEATSGVRFVDETLVKNYRTARNLVDTTSSWFQGLAAEGLLPAHTSPTAVRGPTPRHGVRRDTVAKAERPARIAKWVSEAQTLPAEDGNPGGTIALLVRTNQQAVTVRDWLAEADIPCEVATGGGFFRSDAVREFRTLVRALLHPRDIGALQDLSDTAWGCPTVPWQALVTLDWDRARLSQTWLERVRESPEASAWLQNVRRLAADARVEPLPAVLRDAIVQLRPAAGFAGRLLVESPSMDESIRRGRVALYERSLEHLITLIQEQFDREFVTLRTLDRWLTLRMATDQTEHGPEPSAAQGPRIIAITVHRAKGDQFDTVILPFLDQGFRPHGDMVLLDPEDGRRVGIRLVRGKHHFSNDHLDALFPVEADELAADEARLLYVAMTRAMRRLWLLHTAEEPERTWGWLIRKAQGSR